MKTDDVEMESPIHSKDERRSSGSLATRSQCKLASDGLMGAERDRLVTDLAEAFTTDCKRHNRYAIMPTRIAFS
jgi:hypothetical protein